MYLIQGRPQLVEVFCIEHEKIDLTATTTKTKRSKSHESKCLKALFYNDLS